MATSDTIIVIPARLSSKRLPHKPLQHIDGKPLIWHSCLRALESQQGDVILSSDDERVLQAAPKGVLRHSWKGREYCGSDRVAQVAIDYDGLIYFEHVINFQGDMPFCPPDLIQAVAFERRNSKADIVTAAAPIKPVRPVGVDEQDRAIRFYRVSVMAHIGIYAFTAESLGKFGKLPPSENELNHGLEGWRAIDAGMSIEVMPFAYWPMEVNTESDVALANATAKAVWRSADAGESD